MNIPFTDWQQESCHFDWEVDRDIADDSILRIN
jgi:hypothetical protein